MTFRFFALTLLLCTCVPALCQTPPPTGKSNKSWTDTDARRYARDRADSTLWDTEMFLEDLEYRAPADGLRPAISDMPSPVPAYDWGYVSMRLFAPEIEDKALKGFTLAYARDAYRREDYQDTTAYYYTYCNIVVLTDRPEEGNARVHTVSRNYPHYLTTGKHRTSVGDVDWVQMSLAGGENFLIVNQRYFDLRYGRTVLVAPHTDGSLRLLQLADSVDEVRKGSFQNPENQAELRAFAERLSKDPRVIDFFTAPGTLTYR